MEVTESAALTYLLISIMSPNIVVPGTYSAYRAHATYMNKIDENAFLGTRKPWEMRPQLTGISASQQDEQISAIFEFAQKMQDSMTATPEDCEAVFQDKMLELLA